VVATDGGTAPPEGGSRTASLADEQPGAPPPEGARFRDRLQHALGSAYEILAFVGKGGFARVYRARDRRLDRIVAIKVIRPEVAESPRFVDSFRSEGIALAQLRHPGIIPIYDIRERDGLIWYVMPFVEGATLEARLERGRLAPYEARRILSELADALAATHGANMVHRDIKPANVFLEGDLQNVLLMDFGTAMAVAEQVPDAPDDVVAGTPAYMSPEQARGLPEIDHRSDIYSLGILGYRMLMGRPPFTGRTAREVFQKHVSEAPVSIRDIHPSIPREFADAIMRCLEKDPWQRFQTAKELRGALDAVTFFGTSVEAAPSAPSEGIPRQVVAVVAGVALLLGLLAGLVLS
jgi:serine/threonine-protein kinase